MCKSPLHPLLVALPKCEHHMHVEGSLSPELLFDLAARNGVRLPSDDPAFASVETLYARYDRFTSLDDFLHYYYIGMSVLQTAADFEALAFAYFTRAHAARVRHAEIFFDPQAHLARGIALADIVRGLHAASRRALATWGLTSLLIPCLLRHLPVNDSAAVAAMLRRDGYWAEPAANAPEETTATTAGTTQNADTLLIGALAGLGLCSSEKDRPPALWRDVFVEASLPTTATTATMAATSAPSPNDAPVRRVTAHAGEEGPPSYILEALDVLGAIRIDHGIAAARDDAVLARLARDQVLLTVCPLSNVRLRAAASVQDVPIHTFLAADVPFSINSDDPAYFGGYIQENYCAVQDAHALDTGHWATIVRNSVRGSWCGDARKQALMAEIDSVLSAWHAGSLMAA